MTVVEAIVLGALQGVTEFLPISSSGHLALAQHFLGIEEADIAFDVVLHVATLFAVLVVYRDSLRSIAAAVRTHIVSADTYRKPAAALRGSPELRLLGAIVLGSIPTAILGLWLRQPMEAAFDRPGFVASMLLVTGLVLLLPKLRAHDDERVDDSGDSAGGVGPLQAIGVGVVQGLAVTPGISRSGSTISAARLLGIGREEAARFSFLLSIPAILGAMLLQLPALRASSVTLPVLAIGFATSFVLGWASLRLLLAVLRRGRFALFSVYCFALGTTVLIVVV